MNRLRVLLATFTLLAGTAFGQIPSTFFAMDVNQNNSGDPWPSTVTGVKFGAYRTLGSAIKWADVYNCTTNQYTFIANPGTSNLDKWLKLAQANGQKVMFTAYYTPECFTAFTGTSADTSCAFSAQPSGCDLPSDIDLNGNGTDQTWKTFISTLMNYVVANYGSGFLKYLEVWNEPNISTECNAVNNCTPAALARLVQDAATTAKAIDPTVLIISPAVTSKSTTTDCTQSGSPAQIAPYLSTLLSQKLGGTTFIVPADADIIGFHGYVHIPTQGANTASPDPASGATCEAALIANVQSVVSGFTTTKQIYDTEGSWGADCRTPGCTSTPNTWITAPAPPQTADSQERAFTGIFYLTQASNNVCLTTPCNTMAGVSWYAWDIGNTGDFWNLTALTLTPAGQAYTNVYNWLNTNSAKPTAPCAKMAANTVWSCNFTGAGGYRSEAAWDPAQTCNTTGGCVTVSRTAPSWAIQYRDLFGVTHAITGGRVPVGLLPILLEN